MQGQISFASAGPHPIFAFYANIAIIAVKSKCRNGICRALRGMQRVFGGGSGESSGLWMRQFGVCSGVSLRRAGTAEEKGKSENIPSGDTVFAEKNVTLKIQNR